MRVLTGLATLINTDIKHREGGSSAEGKMKPCESLEWREKRKVPQRETQKQRNHLPFRCWKDRMSSLKRTHNIHMWWRVIGLIRGEYIYLRYEFTRHYQISNVPFLWCIKLAMYQLNASDIHKHVIPAVLTCAKKELAVWFMLQSVLRKHRHQGCRKVQ